MVVWTKLDQSATRDVALTAVLHNANGEEEEIPEIPEIPIVVRNGDTILESLSMALDIRPAALDRATLVNRVVGGVGSSEETALCFDIDLTPSRWTHLEIQDNSTVHVWRSPPPSLGENKLLSLSLKSHPGLFLADSATCLEERGTEVTTAL